jgi:DNA-binding HxlR family transcriptional regulator
LTTLAVVGGIISRANGEILMNEINVLITSFTDSLSLSALRPGYVLSHEFFAADPDFQEKLGFGNSKGQTGNLSDTRKNAAASGLPTANRSVASVGQKSIEKQGDIVKDKKNIRQSQIIELLRQRSHLTIRDFSIVISDCSEKTIQRELIDLVEKGLVKREGERRWSTYSLR